MTFLLAITDFSLGEGIYTAEQLARLVPRLGYRDLVTWDHGLHGYPKLRDELEYAQEVTRFLGAPSRTRTFRRILGATFIGLAAWMILAR